MTIRRITIFLAILLVDFFEFLFKKLLTLYRLCPILFLLRWGNFSRYKINLKKFHLILKNIDTFLENYKVELSTKFNNLKIKIMKNITYAIDRKTAATNLLNAYEFFEKVNGNKPA